jgi:hypothetical protein
MYFPPIGIREVAVTERFAAGILPDHTAEISAAVAV